MKKLIIDPNYLLKNLKKLLEVPSPTGYTDSIVHCVGEELQNLGVEFELTRRGGIRATLEGKQKSPDRAIVVHLDTIGAMVSGIKDNGRLRVAPVGTWSSRFAEGSRVTVLADKKTFRGTLLPLKASGHRFNEEVDTQAISWDNLELRLDEVADSLKEAKALGIEIGHFVAVDPNYEYNKSGYINARNLDNKAGVALLLAAIQAIKAEALHLPVDCHLLFTISEEVGSGASSILHGDIAEMVSIDNSTPAPDQNSIERGITICMMDSSGPFDYHLTKKLIKLCQDHYLPFSRDVFRYYRCDAASAIESGNDIRTALACFGLDSSHGYERSHMDSLVALAELMTLYMQSAPTFKRDKEALAPFKGFPTQPAGSFI
ncbi:MAG: osmoprotectant NAGGN system M42 family peptidase [Deltaproteobacteria bacterium]|nr:osmoprotectant NAGGN system M42 family peptidase [Deltaproteobacteria bacterium]